MIRFAEAGLEARRWKTFENLVSLPETASTNDLAREIVELYFTEDQSFFPTVLVAESQPGARGRRGRWHAPPGRGLYFTCVFAAKGAPISLVPIAVARWVREAVRRDTGVTAELKWPNDLYVGRRKLAGVLAEARTQAERTLVAVGVGLNVSGTAASLPVPNATTIEEEAGQAVPRAALLQALLDRLDAELVAPDWKAEVAAWESASLHRRGDRLRVRREGEELSGEYLGIDASGFLRLRTERGEAVVATGEVAEW